MRDMHIGPAEDSTAAVCKLKACKPIKNCRDHFTWYNLQRWRLRKGYRFSQNIIYWKLEVMNNGARFVLDCRACSVAL